MNIQDIYQKFDKIGTFTFATVEDGRPRTRIAHLFAFDVDGLYFRTMTIKPFYAQLVKTSLVSICGMSPNAAVSHDDNGMPGWEPGYTINLTGDVKEISFETLKQKAAVEPMFELGVKDIERYPAMTTFCIYKGSGEVYDYDFEMENRSHKLLRIPFSFGEIEVPFRGLRITDKCIGCGKCFEKCTFKAIEAEGDKFRIDNSKCDVCGDCYTVCPAEAIDVISAG